MRTTNLVKEEDSALGRERGEGEKPRGPGLRDQKGGDAALLENKQDGQKPQHSDLAITVTVRGHSGGQAEFWGDWRKSKLDLRHLPLIFCFCQSCKCSKFIENLYAQRLWLLPSGTLQYSLLAEMFVNYLVCLVLRKKQRTRQLILPQKFLSGAAS